MDLNSVPFEPTLLVKHLATLDAGEKVFAGQSRIKVWMGLPMMPDQSDSAFALHPTYRTGNGLMDCFHMILEPGWTAEGFVVTLVTRMVEDLVMDRLYVGVEMAALRKALFAGRTSMWLGLVMDCQYVFLEQGSGAGFVRTMLASKRFDLIMGHLYVEVKPGFLRVSFWTLRAGKRSVVVMDG